MKIYHSSHHYFDRLVPSGYGEMYKWVDEKGTVHFTDDLSKIPEKYRQDAETRKPPKEISLRNPRKSPNPLSLQKLLNPKGLPLTFCEERNCCWQRSF